MYTLGESRETENYVFVVNVLPNIMTCRLRHSIESDNDKENIYCAYQKSRADCKIACDNQQCHLSA